MQHRCDHCGRPCYCRSANWIGRAGALYCGRACLCAAEDHPHLILFCGDDGDHEPPVDLTAITGLTPESQP